VPVSDKQTLDNIEKYGCHVLGILEDDDPAFTYSVGIYEKTQQAEVIVVGLNNSLAHSMVNKYNQRLKDGELFESGKLYSDFLEGFDVCFIKVAEKYYDEYSLACNTHYREAKYDLVQMVWPTTDGEWPWDANTSEFYKWAQPILNETGELKKI